jgi:hypothetical protein
MDTATEETVSTTIPPTLDQLAKEIEEAHDAAERCMYDGVEYARRAGVKLLAAKQQLPYGQFLSWVKDKCGIPKSTCYLYIKIAKEWNTLAEVQRVRRLSLRQASQLLDMGNDEEHANTVGELVNLGILRWSDLDGLGAIEARTFVTEVQDAYKDYCFDVDDTVLAERAARTSDWGPAWTCDRQFIRHQAREVLADLKTGKIGSLQVRGRLRVMDKCDPKARSGSSQSSSGNSPEYPAPLPMEVLGASPMNWYPKRARTFIEDTRSLSKEVVTLYGWECNALLGEIANVREVLAEVEEQMTARLRQTELEDEAEEQASQAAAA